MSNESVFSWDRMMHWLTLNANWFSLLVLLLAFASLSIFATVYARAHRHQLRGSFGGLISLLALSVWFLPAVGILGYVACCAAPLFEDGTPPPLSALTRELEVTDTDLALNDDGLIPLETPSPGSPSADNDSLPAWTKWTRRNIGDTTILVLRSKQYVSIEETEYELFPAVSELVQHHFHQLHPYKGTWEIPPEMLQDLAIADRYEQDVERDFGRMHRLYLQVKLSPDTREKFYAIWRTQIVERRLKALGSFFGLAVLMLSAVAGYFRLDLLTSGAHRLSLKLAAASMILAGTLVATSIIPRL